MLVSGSSGCGKSTFICKLLSDMDNAVDTKIHKVHWCYSEGNAKPHLPSHVEQRLNIKYHRGLPLTFQNDGNFPTLLVLDDLMNETGDDERISLLFSRGSHHRSISVILTTQNLFHQGKFFRTISLNCKYIVVFKNPRDVFQMQALAKQIYPENSRELNRVYKEATRTPHSYLLLDLTQNINPQLRFRTGNIFDDDICVCYCDLKELATATDLNDDGAGETNELEAAHGEPAYPIRPKIGE